MKIIDERPDLKMVLFSAVWGGDIFRFNDTFYMKAHDHETEEAVGVKLTTGEITHFLSGDYVIPVSAELHILN